MRVTCKMMLMGVVIVAAGCDSINVRQIDARKRTAEANSANVSQVVVRVEKTQMGSDETSYGPKIEITNSSGAVIFVTGVELMVGNVIYPDSNPTPRRFPIAIEPGKTDSLTAVFQLREGGRKSFGQVSEIAVNYRGENVEQVFRASVSGRVW